jgi:hypothetical protein
MPQFSTYLSIQAHASKAVQTRTLCIPDPTHSRPAYELTFNRRALFRTATYGCVLHDFQSIRWPHACPRTILM